MVDVFVQFLNILLKVLYRKMCFRICIIEKKIVLLRVFWTKSIIFRSYKGTK